MPRKIVLDVDPGFVDAMVLSIALFDPEVEVLAVTSVGGNVPPALAAKNLQAILEFLDPPRLPRIGIGAAPEQGLPVDARHVHGIDGLCGTSLPVAELRTQHPAEKVICDAVRSSPDMVTVVALGPLTNIARAFQRDPELPQLIDHLVIQGGCIKGPGNITPVAEFNMYCDPNAAKLVLNALCTKILVPLDVTNPIMLTLGHLSQLPSEETKLGAFLRRILMPGFRVYRQNYALEGIHIHDLLTYMVATRPNLWTVQEMAGDVETEGLITRGMTVFDRRPIRDWRLNMGVVGQIDSEAVLHEMIKGLVYSDTRVR